jgi:hypothetical protein
MRLTKTLAIVTAYLLVYGILNTPFSHYRFFVGEDALATRLVWVIAALIKLVATYIFGRSLFLEKNQIAWMCATGILGRLAMGLPFSMIALGFVFFFTDSFTFRTINSTNKINN